MTIIVWVSGGVVQSVQADDPAVQILVHDYDDIKEGGEAPALPEGHEEWPEVWPKPNYFKQAVDGGAP